LGGEKIAELRDEKERICAVCGKVAEENCYRVGHVMSAHKLAMCEECFDGGKTWMDLAAQYFDD
jgi:hypothetical protein